MRRGKAKKKSQRWREKRAAREREKWKEKEAWERVFTPNKKERKEKKKENKSNKKYKMCGKENSKVKRGRVRDFG